MFSVYFTISQLSKDEIGSEADHIKSEAVPLHAMEAHEGRGGIALTHTQPRHQMGVSGQRHAPAALYFRGKNPRYPLDRRLGGPQSRSGRRG
jgi:hypothetical protein